MKRFVNFSFAFRSAASGSMPSLRERFAIAKNRSPISSSACDRCPVLPDSTTSGNQAIGLTLAFNSIGWKPQNILTQALDVLRSRLYEADREKLGQVLGHLLDNAIRYSPAGGTVTVAARRRDDAVEVSVEDEGVGIPHAEQERIFRKFYRGDAAAGAVGAGATGLGLFLAEGLVTAMGGRIWVDSDEGRGSTFVLELRAAGSET